jgi:2,5-furandicarboxylate decarboxylase 1
MNMEPDLMTPFTEGFRGFLERLREAKELVDIRQPVDIRHVATLVDQSDKAF